MEFKSVNNYRQRNNITQYELEEIFSIQYNDLFSKILLIPLDEFYTLLKKQVLLHLKIIDKQNYFSLISYFYQKFYKKCQKDKFRILNIYEEMLNFQEDNFIYLNTLDVYIHCIKCKEAIHKCGKPLIIYDDLLFCLKCKKVYNKNQIKLYCKECKKTYLTTKRSLMEKNHEYFYSISYMNYHCYIENEEKVKCLKCGEDLYYNINKLSNEEYHNGIRDIYCIKCKLIFDTKKIFFKCKICGKNFKCVPQIYRNFSSIKKYLLLLIHTFRKGIYALPNIITNKNCNCNLEGVLCYFHHDEGTLFEGKKNGKSVIICDCCLGIFKMENFNWSCPFCGNNFKAIKSNNSNLSKKKDIRVITKQKNILIPNVPKINLYNETNNNFKYYNYNDSLVIQSEKNYNTSRQLTNSNSLCIMHNRGFSLNHKKSQRNYLNEYNSGNHNIIHNISNYDSYRNNNRIIFNSGNYSRNNSNDEYIYRESANFERRNNKLNLKYKNINPKKHINSEITNIYEYSNINNKNNLKRDISNFDKIYYTQNSINSFNNNMSNNVNIRTNSFNLSNINYNYNNSHYNLVKRKYINQEQIKIPSSEKLKISKSLYNINQPIYQKINQQSKIPNIRKIILEKKIKNPCNNLNNINININNNLIQMNYSKNNLNGQKNDVNFRKLVFLKKNYKKERKSDVHSNDYNENRNNFNDEIYINNNISEYREACLRNEKNDYKNSSIKMNEKKDKSIKILFRSKPINIENRQKNNKNEDINNIKTNDKDIINTKKGKISSIYIIKDNKENISINKNENMDDLRNIIIKVDDNCNKGNNKKENIKKINNLNDIEKCKKMKIIKKIKSEAKSQENRVKTVYRNKNNFRNQKIINDKYIKTDNLNDIKLFKKKSMNSNKNKNNINNNNDSEINNKIIGIKKENKNEINFNINNNKSQKPKKIKEFHNKNNQKEFNNNLIMDRKAPVEPIIKNSNSNLNILVENSNNNLIKIKKEHLNNHYIHNKNNLSININDIRQKYFNTEKNDNINNKRINSNILETVCETDIENKKINNNTDRNIEDTKNEKKNNWNKNNNSVIIKNKNNNLKNDIMNNHSISNYLNKNLDNELNSNNNKIEKNNLNTFKNLNNKNNNSSLILNNNTLKKNLSKSLNNNARINKNKINNDVKKVKNSKMNINQKINIEIQKNINDLINSLNNKKIINNSVLNINNINNIKEKINNDSKIINENKIDNNINNLIIQNNDMASNMVNSPIKIFLGNNICNNISKSINFNLIANANSNLNNNNVHYNLDENILSNNLNNNVPKSERNNDFINNKIDINLNSNISNIKENLQDIIINDNDLSKDNTKDSQNINKHIFIENNNINNIQNINNDIINTNNNNINYVNNLIQNNNITKENNLILKQKNIKNIKKDSNVTKLKKYFSLMGKEKEQKTKRRISFDCRLSKNHFKLFNSQDIEVKTFDSNYYKIIRQIGKGTYGEIYLVQDPKTSLLFALKKIIINNAFELRSNQEEYKLTWTLTHANPQLKIVKKYAIEIKKLDQYNLVMYILMEAANCDWEHELLNRQKANAFYTEIELITILKSLVNTLTYLQKKGISHRDVKPQNILCFGNEGYKLADFGEAKTKTRQNRVKNLYGFEQNTTKQTVRGTELYMSPILFKALRTKNLEGAQYNAYKSDVFSLGMCFLLASSLNYQSLFEIREILDIKIIEDIVNKYLGKLYSKNYINLLINMLQIDEKLRPDFIQLSTVIESLN